MYTGTLIHDLLIVADRVRDSVRRQGTTSFPGIISESIVVEPGSEPEQFAQALGLGAADGNFGLFLVVHPELVGTLEPGHDLADAVDVHQVGAVGAPENLGSRDSSSSSSVRQFDWPSMLAPAVTTVITPSSIEA